jgi:hypothetical protein
MDRLGIDRAVAWHTSAKTGQPMPGNEQLIKEIESSGARDRIIPSFIISASMISEPGIMEHFKDLVKTHRIRAFHFFPGKEDSFSGIKPVIHEIADYKPVIFLESSVIMGKDGPDILSLTEEFKQVSLIITNAMWSHYEKLYALMESRSNIYVDLSLMHTYRTIEYIIERFGVERLIFGTGYKSNNGASIALLAHSEINRQQAELIAHGNLERLLDIKSPLKGFKPVEGNRLWHKLLRREPLGPEIIDAHTHFSTTRTKWVDHDPADFNSHVNQSLQYMDVMGVSKMIIAQYETDIPSTPESMTFLEEHLNPHIDRFRGYFCALPFKTEPEEKMIPMLDKLFSRPFYVGFKMHNDHWSIPVTDPCFIPMWKYADNHRLPILLHTWNSRYNGIKMLNDIVPKYPHAIFILGHSGNTDRPDGEKLAKDYPNVYLEWCGSFMNPSDWRETIDRIGNHRILFGSDGVSWETMWGHSPAWEMGRLLSMDLPDNIFIPMLGGNISKILSLKM